MVATPDGEPIVAAEQTFDHGTAFSVEDRRVTRFKAGESVISAGPLAGVPEPQQRTDMHAIASGEQVAGSELRVRTQRAGFAATENGAAGVWRREGDTLFRGFDPPPKWGGHRAIQWQDGSGDYKYAQNPSVVTLPDDTVVIAYDFRNTAVSAEEFGVRVKRIVPDSGNISAEVQVYAQQPQPNTAAGNTFFYPNLLILPNGRLMLYFFVYEVGFFAQVRAFYSDDGAVTWAAGEEFSLEADIDTGSAGFEPLRITTAYNNMQVCLFLHLQRIATTAPPDSNDVLAQYRSADLGNNFILVVQQDGVASAPGTGGAGFPSLIAVGQGFGLAYVDAGSTLGGTIGDPIGLYVPLGSADQPFTEVIEAGDQVTIAATVQPWATVTTPGAQLFGEGECTATVDDSGNIWIFTQHVSISATAGSHEGLAYVSSDGGLSFKATSLGDSTTGDKGRWWNTADEDTFPQRIQATWARGQCLFACHHVSTVAAFGGSVSVLLLGGWSTVTMPGLERFKTLDRRVSLETLTYAPFDPPEVMGWTAAGAGTGVVQSTGFLRVTTTAAQARNYTYVGATSAGSATRGIIVEAMVTQIVGGSQANTDIGILVQVQDATDTMIIQLQIDATGYVVRDVTNAADLATVTTVAPSGGIHFLIALTEGAVLVAHRAIDYSGDRDFEIGFQGTVVPGGGGGGGNSVVWAHINGALAATSDWEMIAICDGTGTVGATPFTGLQIAQGQANPADLYPQQFASTAGAGGFIADGVRFAVADGPTIRADEWNVDARAEFELDRALLDRSPRITHRTATLTDTAYAFRWSNTDGVQPSDVLVIGFYGSNVPRWRIELENSGGYTVVGTVDVYDGLEIEYSRNGTAVFPAFPDTDTPYLEEGALQGGYLNMTHPAGDTESVRITRSVAGKWTNATTRQAMLTVEDTETDGSDLGRVVMPSAVLIVPLNGAQFRGVRLTAVAPAILPDPRPPEDFFEIGRFHIGWLHPFPEPPSWGRSITLENGQDLQVQRDETFRSYEDYPVQRMVRLGWVDGDDMTSVTGDAADPDFIEAGDNASAEPIAVVGGALQSTGGIYRFVEGPASDIVYIERFENIGASEDIVLLNRRHEHMLCRIDSVHRVDVPQGEEGEDEMWRGQEIVLVETV